MELLKAISSIVFIAVCLSVGTPVYTAVDKDTIIGIWLFDEGISDGVKDASSNEQDGIVVGTPEVVDGKFGKALSFGDQDKVEILHHDRFSTPTFTLMAWVNIEEIRTGYQMIVGKNDHPERNYAMYVHTDGERLHCSFCAGQCMGILTVMQQLSMGIGIMSLLPTTGQLNACISTGSLTTTEK